MGNQQNPNIGSSTWRGALLGLAHFRRLGVLHLIVVAAYLVLTPLVGDAHAPIRDAQGLEFILHLFALLVAGIFLGGVLGLIPALVLGFIGGSLLSLLLGVNTTRANRFSAFLVGGMLTGLLVGVLYGFYWKPWLRFLFPLWPEAGLGGVAEFFIFVTLPGLVYVMAGARLGNKIDWLIIDQA